MNRSKRVIAFLLALAMLFSDMVPAFAEDVKEDVSGNSQIESIFKEISGNDVSISETPSLPIDEETENDVSQCEVSSNDQTIYAAKWYEITLKQEDYFVQLGGLKSARIDEYKTVIKNNDIQKCMSFSDEDYDEKLNLVTKTIHDAVANKSEYVDLSQYSLFCDKSENAEEFILGLVSGAVSYEPSFFYVKGVESYSVDEDGYFSGVVINYDYNASGSTYETALKNAYNEAVTDKNAPAYVKALQCHDWIVQHVSYDDVVDDDFSNPNMYSAYGAIVNREAGCMGYSLAYGDLLTMAGIQCGYVSSDTMNHMWNVVKLDGKWYYVDTTWDDPPGYTLGEERYWFFLKSESVFRNKPTYHAQRKHTGNDWKVCASNTYSYGNWTTVTCNTTKYDYEFWRYAVSSIIYVGGSFYYVYHDPNGNYSANYFVKRTLNNQETVYDMSSLRWTDQQYSSGPCKYYDIHSENSSNCYANLSVVDGYIFISTPKEVLRYKPGDTEFYSIYKVEESGTFIWTSLACGTKMYMRIGSSSLSAKTVSTYLFGIHNLKVTASAKSVNWGDDKAVTFTGSFDKAAAGAPEISWYIKEPDKGYYTKYTGTVSNSDANNKYTSKITLDTLKLDAGSYKIKMNVKLNEDNMEKEYTFTVNQSPFTLTSINLPKTKVYDGLALVTPTYEDCVTNAEELVFSWYKGKELKASQKLEEAPCKAGNYYLKVSCPGRKNVKSGYKSYNIKINKRTLVVEAIPQIITYGNIVPNDLDRVVIGELVQNEKAESVCLKQSTTELTSKGTVTPYNLVIKNENGDNTAVNYSITYKSAKLQITKVQTKITAKSQTITYGQDISRKLSDIFVEGLDESKYTLVSVNLAKSSENAGEGTVVPSGAIIYKVGTNTNVTKYFDLTYESGILTTNKLPVSCEGIENFVSYDDASEFVYNINGLCAVPSDSGNKKYSITNSNPSLLTAEFSEDSAESFVVKLNNNDASNIGNEALIEVYLDSENYEGKLLELRIKVSKTVTVTFNANGGSYPEGEKLTCEVFVGENISEKYQPIAPLYKKFAGWKTSDGSDVSEVSSEVELIAQWETKYKVANPVASIDDGSELKPGTKISLSTETNGAKIYYTINGAEIELTDTNLYSDTIVVDSTMTITAKAVKENYEDSENVTLTYTVKDLSGDYGDIVDEDKGDYPGTDTLWIAGLKENYEYKGTVVVPEIRVYYGKRLLENKKDYKLSTGKNTGVGAASLKITGINNYSGSVSREFTIVPYDIKEHESELEVTGSTVTYTGRPQKPSVSVKRDGKVLKAGTDYTVLYSFGVSDPVSSITGGNETMVYVAHIYGKNGYTGEIKTNVTITPATLMSKATVSGYKNVNYTGNAIVPKLTVKHGGKTLVLVPEENKEDKTADCYYTISNNTNAGTATITLIGCENTSSPRGCYLGTKTVTFKINPLDIKKAKVAGVPSSVMYDGEPVEFATEELSLALGEKMLNYGSDYSVIYKKNTSSGTATVTFKGTGNYKGSVTKKYKITPYNLLTGIGHKDKVEVICDEVVTYTKNGAVPSVKVFFNGKELKAGTDYKLTVSNNKKVGDRKKLPTVTINGKGGFTGSIKAYFSIREADLSGTTISVGDINYSSKAGKYKSSPVIVDINGKTLKSGTDYSIAGYSYGEDAIVYVGNTSVAVHEGDSIGNKDILPVGTKVSVTVVGKGNYSGRLTASYRVARASIKSAKCTVDNRIYTGEEITLRKSDITVKLSGKKLETQDYEIVSYDANVKKGTGYVIIEGIGNYSGTKKLSFKITARSIKQE